MAEVTEVPWIVIDGRKGGSTLVVAALHALLGLAEAQERAAQVDSTPQVA
jgi:precorrin-8X/cobalt-precorrin-8 methylmutase